MDWNLVRRQLDRGLSELTERANLDGSHGKRKVDTEARRESLGSGLGNINRHRRVECAADSVVLPLGRMPV